MFQCLKNKWLQICCHQQKDVLKLVECVCDLFFFFLMFFALNTFADVESKRFIVGLSVERVQSSDAHNFRRPAAAAFAPLSAGSHSGRRPRETAWGSTPLHLAAFFGHVEAAELLLSKRAAVDATNTKGPGPQSGKQGQKSVLPLGALQKRLRSVITSNMSINA